MHRPVPKQKKLYEEVKREADAIYDVNSAYKSGYIVKRYKELGGTYAEKGPAKRRRASPSGLKRWFSEKWVDLNSPTSEGQYAQCGRKSSRNGARYPLCRPSVRVTAATPLLVSELSRRPRDSARRRKSHDPRQRVFFRR